MVGASLLFANSGTAGAAYQTVDSAMFSTQTDPYWTQVARGVLRRLYEFLGGDPRDLDSVDDVVVAMSIVRGHYETYGLPENLSEQDQQELLQAVLDLDDLMQAAPPLIPLKAIDLFRATLNQIMTDLTT